MSEHTQGNPDLLYGLHDRPAPGKAFWVPYNTYWPRLSVSLPHH
ncbi:hypothetical protein ACT3QO_03475 [Psychrobacter sp. AOP7-D1-15]